MGIPDYASEWIKTDQERIEQRMIKDILDKPSNKQVGGSHYKQFKIQPAEFCYYNNIPYLEATAIKYLCRWKDKGGIQDLEKARHYIDLLLEFTEEEDKNESRIT